MNKFKFLGNLCKKFDKIMDDILQNKTFIKQNIRRLNKNIDTFNEKDQINFFNESYYGINLELYLKMINLNYLRLFQQTYQTYL